MMDQIQDVEFRRAVELLDAGDLEGLRSQLREHSHLIRQRVVFEGENYFQNPSLLEFVARNPVRQSSLPANIVQIARLILDAGAKDDPRALNETLLLVCTGQVSRECGVQVPLIDLLCDYGAEPDYGMPLGHGEFEAVETLLRRGARLTLPVAAALGRVPDALRLLSDASASERHGALALSAQFGHLSIVRMLLHAGEDPNRYNPPGCHGHSTPLHQAALAGHMEVIRLLLQHGARSDFLDTMWHRTPESWASYGGQAELAQFLADVRSGR